MRDEDSKLDCGIVCIQILINATLQFGRRGEKNRAEWEKSIKEVKVRIGLQCHLRRNFFDLSGLQAIDVTDVREMTARFFC
jgi:hypothetical protein